MDPAAHGTCMAFFIDESYKGKRMLTPDPNADPAAGIDAKPITLYDARTVHEHLSVEKQGLQLVSSPTRVTNFMDDALVTSTFYDECQEIIMAVTGAAETRVIGHLRRQGTALGADFGGVYARAVHADFTPFYESEEGGMTEQLREAVAGKHWAIFNLWRSTDLEGDIERMPLAVCDMSTVSAADIVHAESVGPNGDRKTMYHRLAFNPRQHFYIAPRMTKMETLVFKQYDTRAASPEMRQCFHTAVDDPKTPNNARQRKSIEVRVVAIFGNDDDPIARKAKFESEIPGEPSQRFQAVVNSTAARTAKL